MLPLAPLSALFQALADPSRLRIMALLRSMELSVGELAQVLGQSQPRASRHVRILADAGLVTRRKEGSWVFLQLTDAHRAESLFATIAEWASPDARGLLDGDSARLEAVRADRAEAAARYFASHAEIWDSIRSLHVAECEVELAIASALGDEPLGRLVDIGTGTGRMLELFGPLADSAIGIDRSSEMLRLARVKLEASGIRGASLRQGDMYALPLPDASADVVILHQVLHYAQAPAHAIAEAGRLLGPGGRLLIVDFAPHDREELRDTDAHQRLGFADPAISGWFEGAGLTAEASQHLAGGELTVSLWLARKAGGQQRQRRAA
ncbi:MAG: metalloregulator ArsR/SmtB family transcription factor [Pseudomonadota bacterium]|nr:metalloregulator ArsR/SmtB family transcription factor [Pseudomonadota bacterium]